MAGVKRNTVKTILRYLLTMGLIAVAATNPRFGPSLLRAAIRDYKYKNKFKKNNPKNFYSAFAYLRKKGLIHIEYKGQQMYFSLTEEGKRRAGRYKIDDLKIEKSKKWNGKWHILIFDIEDKQKIKREALRGKLKELELYQLQKSVWVYPYSFGKQIGLLRDFFGLTDKEMKIIIADSIENDKPIRDFFKV
jgi:DNA-binding transcriptional ArsR family regulator